MDPHNASALVVVGSNWDELPVGLRPTLERLTEAHEVKHGGLQPATSADDDQEVTAEQVDQGAAEGEGDMEGVVLE
jgi:hypothetical protein